MLTTMFPREVSRFGRLKGGEKLINRSKLLVERYPQRKRGIGVDAFIASHLLLRALLNQKERRKYSYEEIQSLSWEIEHDKEIRKNERRLIAERDSALILASIGDKMNPLLTGKEKPDYLHSELLETGITSLDVLERFIDEVPRRADGYRGLIERIGNMCHACGYAEDVLPMLHNSIEIFRKMEFDSPDNVGCQLYMMHMSLHKAEKIMNMLKSRKLFENPEFNNLRHTIIILYIKRGAITTEGKCDLIKIDSVVESFELFDNELIKMLREKAGNLGDGLVDRIVDAHDRLSDTLKTKRGGELIESVIREIRNATSSLKK